MCIVSYITYKASVDALSACLQKLNSGDSILTIVLYVEWGRSWTEKNFLWSYSKGHPSVVVYHHGGLPTRGPIKIAWETTSPAITFSALVHNPGNSQLRQRILHIISWIILQRKEVVSYQGFESCTSKWWLRDCFCVSYRTSKPQLTAWEGGYPWGRKIMSQPCLVLLRPHLSWVFLLQLSQHQLALLVIRWLLLQQLSPLSFWHAASIFFIYTMAILTNTYISKTWMWYIRWKKSMSSAEGASICTVWKGYI